MLDDDDQRIPPTAENMRRFPLNFLVKIMGAITEDADPEQLGKHEVSGLVREDHYDWTEKLGPILDEAKPEVLVVMLGSNDRQPMTVGSRSLPSRSEEWVRRVNEHLAALDGIPWTVVTSCTARLAEARLVRAVGE